MNCPKKNTMQGTSPLKAIEDALHLLGNLDDEDGYTQPKKTTAHRPTPRQITMADFVTPGRFAPLANIDDTTRHTHSTCNPAQSAIQRRETFIKSRGQRQSQPKQTTKTPLDDHSGNSDLTRRSNSPKAELKRSGAQWCVPADEPALAKPPGKHHAARDGPRFTTTIDHPTKSQPTSDGLSEEDLKSLMQVIEKMEAIGDDGSDVCTLEEEEGPDQLLMTGVNEASKVRVTVAMDSGAAKNVANPNDLPRGVKITPNTSGKHFVGPGGECIVKHGTCTTVVDGGHGKMQCRWHAADVTRPLHAVSQVAGPEDGDGLHDVLFTNKKCVVVPPGIVEKVLKVIKPLAEYKRKGGLYLADLELSCMPEEDFPRPGAQA
jgi:hypothetical protein